MFDNNKGTGEYNISGFGYTVSGISFVTGLALPMRFDENRHLDHKDIVSQKDSLTECEDKILKRLLLYQSRKEDQKL